MKKVLIELPNAVYDAIMRSNDKNYVFDAIRKGSLIEDKKEKVNRTRN